MRIEIEQRTPEWFALRNGKATGSKFDKVMGSAVVRNTYAWEVAASMFVDESLDINAPEYENDANRGTRLEPEALSRYEFEYNTNLKRGGIVLSDENIMSSSSPDGEEGDPITIDAKCLSHAKHLQAYIERDVPQHKPQAINYFLCKDTCEEVRFAMYNPCMPSMDFFVITYKRADMLEEIEKGREMRNSFQSMVVDILEKVIIK
jgi:hypothetical protein